MIEALAANGVDLSTVVPSGACVAVVWYFLNFMRKDRDCRAREDAVRRATQKETMEKLGGIITASTVQSAETTAAMLKFVSAVEHCAFKQRTGIGIPVPEAGG